MGVKEKKSNSVVSGEVTNSLYAGQTPLCPLASSPPIHIALGVEGSSGFLSAGSGNIISHSTHSQGCNSRWDHPEIEHTV